MRKALIEITKTAEVFQGDPVMISQKCFDLFSPRQELQWTID